MIFRIIRSMSSPNNINTKARDGFKYMFPSLTSNFEERIRKKEKIAPIVTASSTWLHSTRNTGKTNIRAPVLINKGGNIIFFTLAGRFAALIRTKIIAVAMKAAATELAIIQNIRFTLSYFYIQSAWALVSLEAVKMIVIVIPIQVKYTPKSKIIAVASSVLPKIGSWK